MISINKLLILRITFGKMCLSTFLEAQLSKQQMIFKWIFTAHQGECYVQSLDILTGDYSVKIQQQHRILGNVCPQLELAWASFRYAKDAQSRTSGSQRGTSSLVHGGVGGSLSSWVRSSLGHFLAVTSWANYLAFLCLGFFLSNWGNHRFAGGLNQFM